MSTDHDLEKNKAFVRDHFEEFVNRKNAAIAERNFAPGFLDHDEPYGESTGPEPARRMMEAMYQRFPDLRVTIHDLIAEGSKVVARNTWTATDPATGKRLAFSGIVIWRIEGGQLVERWAKLEPPREVKDG